MFGIDDIAIAAGGAALFSFMGGRETNAANAAQASDQMAFQERMSNSAHQREMRDLQAAGLNPLLSARYAGSSTPVGAMAQMHNPASSAAQAGMDVYRGGLEGRRNPSVIKLQESQADLSRQKVLESVAQSENLNASSKRIMYEVEKLLPSQDWLARASAAEKDWVATKIAQEVHRLIPSQQQLNEASAKHHEMQVETLRAKLRGLLIEEKIDTTAWAGFWRYVARMVKGTLGSVLNFSE